MATYRKRGDFQWQVQVRRNGHPNLTKTFNTKADAESWARDIESKLDKGIFIDYMPAQQTTLLMAVDRYRKEVTPKKKGWRSELSKLKILEKHLGDYSISGINSQLIAHYRDLRLEVVTGETAIKELNLISRILRTAASDWDITLPAGNPVQFIKKPSRSKSRSRRLNSNEEEKLIAEAKEYGQSIPPLIVLAIETAMRRGELSNLKWNDIDYKNRVITLYETKNGESREVPLSMRAYNLLNKMPRNINGRLFDIRADSITQAFARVCERVNIQDLRFHDLRHETTSGLFEKGFNMMEVASITGHKELSMLKRYTHLRAKDLAKRLVSPEGSPSLYG